MSEIRREPLYRNTFDTGFTRSGEWKTIRFLVTRDSTDFLTAALVEVPAHGHPRLDSRIRGLQVEWHPEDITEDLRIGALRRALWGVSQTHS